MGFAKKLLFMPAVMEFLSSGRFFRMSVGRLLQVAAVSGAIGGILVWCRLLVGMLEVFPSSGVSGIVVFLLSLLVCLYVTTHTLWIRGKEIASSEDSDIVVLPIVITIIRMTGEVCATCLVLIGLGGCLGTWLSFGALSDIPLDLPGLGSSDIFYGGILCLVYCSLAALGVALTTYLHAELLSLFVSMARDLKAIRGKDAAPEAVLERPVASAPSGGDEPAY